MASLAGNGGGRIDPRALLTFPCRVDIKAVGRQSVRFQALVHGIVSRHVPNEDLHSTRSRTSSGGKYLSVTLTVTAGSRAQLDRIYTELSRCKDVLIAL